MPTPLDKVYSAAVYGQRHSRHSGFKHGAVIECAGRSYYGANQTKTHPLSPKPNRQLCAEMDALRKTMGPRLLMSRRQPSLCGRAVLYVGRLNRNGELANSRPCQFCVGALRRLHVHTVFYSSSEGARMMFIGSCVRARRGG